MTEWSTLRARFPEDELAEIRRIKERYGLSYSEKRKFVPSSTHQTGNYVDHIVF
jgi:hypothetical protein